MSWAWLTVPTAPDHAKKRPTIARTAFAEPSRVGRWSVSEEG